MGLKERIDRAKDFFERRAQIAVLVDVAKELLAQQLLAGGQVQELELFPEVVDQVVLFDADRFQVFLLLELLLGAADIESVEEDLLPIDFVFLVLGFLLLLGRRLLLLLLLFFRLQQLEERIDEQLLLQVLLQVHHRHVQHVHGLIEPWIDPELLAKPSVL